jgi:sugar lactone lactonase YvrE
MKNPTEISEERNYYVTDSANNVIIRVSASGGAPTNLVGFPGESGSRDARGAFARFNNPRGLVNLPGQSALVVADTGNRALRRVSSGGADEGEVKTLGLDRPWLLAAPVAVAVDARTNETRLYVADVQANAVFRVTYTNPENAQIVTLATNLFRPSAVAVDDQGRVLVADRDNNCVRLISDTNTLEQTAVQVIAGSGTPEGFGLRNSTRGVDALFETPISLLWIGGTAGLLVGDSGNHLLRQVTYQFTDDALGLRVYAVETYAPSEGAGFGNPTGLARDASGNIIVVDKANVNVRRFNVTQTTQVPVNSPVIGTVVFIASESFTGTRLTPVTDSTFNNDVTVAVLTERGTRTFFTKGDTRRAEGVPDPTAQNSSPPSYEDGAAELPDSLIKPIEEDVTIKAFSTQPGRPASKVVASRFRFQVSNPVISGSDPTSIALSTATKSASLHYTIGTTNAPPKDPTTASPRYDGTPVNPFQTVGTTDAVLKVKGIRSGYSDSTVVQRVFVFEELSKLTNTTKLGFSRPLFGGSGATVVVPIDVRLAGNDALQSLQFRVVAEPSEAGTPALAQPLRLLPSGPRDFLALNLPGSNPNSAIAYSHPSTTSPGAVLQVLAVAYLGSNNLERVEQSGPLALLAFSIPSSAANGQQYNLRIENQSGTSDGLQANVRLQPLNNVLIVSNRTYQVGDTAPVKWYNAGDPDFGFGDGVLGNDDVNNAFYASLGVRVPFASSDLFDAMDAYPEDGLASVGGDGQIRFMDWQIILKRSLGILTNSFERTWSGAGRITRAARNSAASPSAAAGEAVAGPWYRAVKFRAGTLENAKAGFPVKVPIYIELKPGVNWAGGQIWPVISSQAHATDSEVWASFEVNADLRLPPPSSNSIVGVSTNNVAFVWDTGRINPPLTGSNLLGRLVLTVPPSAQNGDFFTVRFQNADGATLEEQQLDAETVPGGVWVQSVALRPAARVPDEWKTNYFGSLTLGDAQDDADPDGDGMSNAAEYVLGRDPLTPDWQITARMQNGRPVISWYGESNKTYVVLGAASVPSGASSWVPVSAVMPGRDQMLQFSDSSPAPSRFYRVKLLP